MEKPKFLSFGNPVAWGIGVSILLGCLVTFLAVQIGPDGKTRYDEFLGSPPNVIGDTLAGIFAPLAFIWIVVTVFLQSHELSEQRKELGLTREELALARKAQEAQLSVMQKQADIFDDERNSRDQQASKHYFDELIKQVVHLLLDATSLRWRFVWPHDGAGGQRSEEYQLFSAYGGDLDYEAYTRDASINGFGIINKIRDLSQMIDPTITKTSVRTIKKIEEFLIKILNIKSDLSNAEQARVDRLRIDSLLEIIRIVKSNDDWCFVEDVGKPT